MKTSNEQTTAASRRDFLRGLGSAVVATAVLPAARTSAESVAPALAVTINDNAVGLRQSEGVFAYAAGHGATGVELDLGRIGRGPIMHNRLLDGGTRYQFRLAAHTADVTITSVALTAFTGQSFAGDARAEAFVDDLLFLMRELDVGVGYLPVVVDSDYGRGQCVDKLRRLAVQAELQNAVLAIDVPQSNDALCDLLDAVASPAVLGAVTVGAGRDALADFAALGIDRVGQVRYRHDDDSESLNALARRLLAGGYAGPVVIDRVAAVSDDIPRNTARAVARVSYAFNTACS